MEKIKLINQKKQEKKLLSAIPLRRLKVLRLKPLAYRSDSETKYNENIPLKLLLIYPFFARKDIHRENKKTHYLDEGSKKEKKDPLRGAVFVALGGGGGGGGALVEEHVRGEAGLCLCDVLT